MSRWIDAEWVLAELKVVADRPIQSQLYIIRQAPSIEIVRCKECIFAEIDDEAEMYLCRNCSIHWWNNGEHFCSYGERKE